MYYFKANDKDETEYGPLDAEQIREWVREKRMDNNSLVRKSTDEEWRPLGQVPDWQTSAIPPEGIPPVARTGPPGKVQAIGIMTLVGGILALLTCFGIALGTMFIYIPWIYSLILGIMAIMKGSQMLGSNPAPAFASARTIAIMQIVNIINCDVINLTLGIITLVFLNDPEVKDWLRSKGVEI
jgi:hypothetical protein